MNTEAHSISFNQEWLLFAVLYSICWLIIFVRHLRRSDYTSSDRIIWTIVLATLPIVGLTLYLCLSRTPLQIDQVERKASLKKADLEAEARLKARCNAQ